jgi:hypothetical protein
LTKKGRWIEDRRLSADVGQAARWSKMPQTTRENDNAEAW